MSRNHAEAAESERELVKYLRNCLHFLGHCMEKILKAVDDLLSTKGCMWMEVRAESVNFAASTIPTNATLLERRCKVT
jgi:hypothetical protein